MGLVGEEAVGGAPVGHPVLQLGEAGAFGSQPAAEVDRLQIGAQVVMPNRLHVPAGEGVLAVQLQELGVLAQQRQGLADRVPPWDQQDRVREHPMDAFETGDVAVVLGEVAADGGALVPADGDDLAHLRLEEGVEVRIDGLAPGPDAVLQIALGPEGPPDHLLEGLGALGGDGDAVAVGALAGLDLAPAGP